MFTVCADEVVVEARLGAGGYSCPDSGCLGVLGPWGWARRRVVEDGLGGRGQRRVAFVPRRARCRVCLVTHVLLPVGFFSRRADSARVVGRAVELKAGGLGHRGIAVLLGRPAGTARGWLRSAGVAARAGPDVFRAMAAEVAPDAARVAPRPAASPVGELVASLSALAAAVAARWGGPVPGWEAAGAAACRCRLLQASWWASRAQHELALPPAWWAGPGLV